MPLVAGYHPPEEDAGAARGVHLQHAIGTELRSIRSDSFQRGRVGAFKSIIAIISDCALILIE